VCPCMPRALCCNKFVSLNIEKMFGMLNSVWWRLLLNGALRLRLKKKSLESVDGAEILCGR
jgi:hypothetical protein